MDEKKAIEVVSALANGVNEQTAECFGADFRYQPFDVMRALYLAVRALEIVNRSRERSDKRARAVNQGQVWSEEEDRRLVQEFNGGSTVPEIMELHGRSRASIQARLERHGLVQPQGVMNFRVRSRSVEEGALPEEPSEK